MLAKAKFLIALVLITCAAAASADPPERIGRLNYIYGTTSFASAEDPDQWVQAVLNRPLTSGDRLWIERDGRAEFHLGSTAARLAPYTAVDVLHLDDERLQLRLAQGDVNVRVRDLERDEVVEIATPSGAVLLRQPGSYRISVDAQRESSRVLVHFGQAEVVTPAQTFLVPSGQAAVVPAGAAPYFEVATHAANDEFDRWSAERDRREDRVGASRYVSREMTGYEDLDQYGAWRAVPEYGNVWVPSQVPADWAPYRQGHWSWISPWGWTWIDDAPWGFAPSHYGRWVRLDRHWAWAPGPIVRRPVYAPALVGFIGGSDWSLSVSSGPAVGWFPLGWREPFVPWYRASQRHLHNVNVTHVTNVNHINVTNIRHVHRHRADAVTVVPQHAFVSSRPAWRERQRVRQEDLARAEVIRERPPAQPVRASFASERPGRRPPAEVRAREVMAVNAPAGFSAGLPEREGRAVAPRSSDSERPRVRVLARDRAESAATPQQAAESRRTLRQPQRGESGRADVLQRAPEEAQPQDARRIERERRAQQEAAARAQADAARTQAENARRGRAQAEERGERQQRIERRAERAEQARENPRAVPPQPQAPRVQAHPPLPPTAQVQPQPPRAALPQQAQAPRAQPQQMRVTPPQTQAPRAQPQPQAHQARRNDEDRPQRAGRGREN
ncbi:MAG: DUF6600 domain-containing protein [Burkholderiales bacterium]